VLEETQEFTKSNARHQDNVAIHKEIQEIDSKSNPRWIPKSPHNLSTTHPHV